MDLKGSLIDTNLRIYPSYKLIEFVKTVPPSDQIPYNILQILKSNCKSTFKSYKVQNLKPVQFNSLEREHLKMLRDSIDEIQKDVSPKNKESIDEIQKDVSPKNKEKSNAMQDKDNKENFKVKETFKEKIEITKTIANKSDKNASKVNENKDGNNENQKLTKEKLNSDDIQSVEAVSNDIESVKGVPFLVTSDIDWLYLHIKTRRTNGEMDIPYLHTLLEEASIEMPKNEFIKRNPVLEARCVKLRAQQEAREYRKMTKGVDNVRMRFPEDSISYQMKQLNRHLIAIGQFIISIFAGFLFGFRGVEWMVGNLDFGFRLLLGVMCALVIALAEIYFLAKKLNEELNIPETVQLGGPVKFVDKDSYNYKDNESGLKPHQD